MKQFSTYFSALVVILVVSACTPQKPILWKVTPTGLAEHSSTVMGNPTQTPGRNGATAVAFDGVDDGFLINHNPIAGVDEFTVEVIFKPNAVSSTSQPQRVLHLADPANPGRGLALELTPTGTDQWQASFLLTSDAGEQAFQESSKTHPLGSWATMTLVYKDRKVTGYVNGRPEVSGEMEFQPLPASARVSIGTRMDRRSWYKGEIETVRFFQTALLPKKYSEGIPSTTR